MTLKRAFQMMIDIAMTALLPLLMVYKLMGKSTHEWIGLTMFILSILHHILNYIWYKNILKGHIQVFKSFC